MNSPLRLLILAYFVFCNSSVAAQDVRHHAKDAVELGWTYFNKGDTETALKRFNQARILDPDFAPAYFGTAYVYSVQNKLDLAIQYYRKSIEKDPTFSHSFSNLGLALLASGKPEEAFVMLTKALAIDPQNGDAHVNMAAYYFSIKDYASSWKHIHLAKKHGAEVQPKFLQDLEQQMHEPLQY